MKKHLLQLFILIVSLFTMVYPGNRIAAAMGDVGYKDFTYGLARAVTSEKPQSKLWYHDDLWWGVLYNRLEDRYEIFKFDWVTQIWATTNIPVDPRPFSTHDALSVGDDLFIAGAAMPPDPPGIPDQADKNIYINSFSYDTGSNLYIPGPIAVIWNGSVETVVIDQDTTGKLWATFTTFGPSGLPSVYVAHSQGTPTNWLPANIFVLPFASAANLTADDISTLVAYSGKIGVMWSNQTNSNQNTTSVYFATHVDGAADNMWTSATPLSGPKYADDHLNIKSLQADSAGQVFAVVKTSLNDVNLPTSTEPEILLLMLDNQGSWKRRTVATIADNHTRPIVLIDTENRNIYVFMTLQYPGQTSGAIYYKKVNLDDPGMQFPDGPGTPFIEYIDPDPTNPYHINNASSTKQPLNGTTNLLVIASDDSRQLYLHNYIDLPGLPGPPMFTTFLPLIIK
ncbi:MAG TPA: hypothetical protein VN364_12450 [Bellilinea sp.]|nr:hypothetical protein [Bellilinea sp.]